MDVISIVIFGATGDLSRRKLMPALAKLHMKDQLPDCRIIGFGRKDLTQEKFRELFRLPADFTLEYVRGDYGKPEGYAQLAEITKGSENIMFYITTPPEVYGDIVQQLKTAGLSEEKKGWRRVVIEKPFGQDLFSAKKLNGLIQTVFREDQIFRIDHYLAKETVRKLNHIKATEGKSWGKDTVDHVQITISENLGLEGRGGFYDNTGALRDMVQSHMLQVLALLAMEKPAAVEHTRKEKEKVLRSLVVPEKHEIVRAQYAAGSIAGEPAAGYLDEIGNPSQTETFVALKTGVATDRWHGVPFLLRTGKRMKERYAEIIMFYKDKSGVVMPINPRPGMQDPESPEGHEVLIVKVLQGDAHHFPSAEEIELQWGFIDKIRERWDEMHSYAAGQPGPESSAELMQRHNRSWID